MTDKTVVGSSNERSLVDELRHWAWEYQVSGQLILTAADWIDRASALLPLIERTQGTELAYEVASLLRLQPPQPRATPETPVGCAHCTEVYRIWEANVSAHPANVMIQMRDAASVGMFRPAQETAVPPTREQVERRAQELRETGVNLIPNSWRCQHGTVYAWPIAVAICGCERDALNGNLSQE